MRSGGGRSEFGGEVRRKRDKTRKRTRQEKGQDKKKDSPQRHRVHRGCTENL
jgi:hypothetical protein